MLRSDEGNAREVGGEVLVSEGYCNMREEGSTEGCTAGEGEASWRARKQFGQPQVAEVVWDERL